MPEPLLRPSAERRLRRPVAIGLTLLLLLPPSPALTGEPKVDPGTVRFSHELVLENMTHKLSSGLQVRDNKLNKFYSTSKTAPKWETEWAQRLLTEVATRVTPDIFGRVLVEADGHYADRYWRPVNQEHRAERKNEPVYVREMQARIDKERWYLDAFSGVGHNDWQGQGDFMRLYPVYHPDDDYLGRSSYFGFYPDNFKQNVPLNLAGRRVPRGAEVGTRHGPYEGAVAFGSELNWGYQRSVYARYGGPLGMGRWTFVYKDEDVPYRQVKDSREHNNAYALSAWQPFGRANRFDIGVLWNPFRLDRRYVTADRLGGGAQGSPYVLGTDHTTEADAWGARVRVQAQTPLERRTLRWEVDLEHRGIVAGNREQAGLMLGTDINPGWRWQTQYVYRRPVEGPLPFLYQGSQNNIGAIIANPRGPESPFTVGWNNREAVLVTTTFIFDPSPNTPFLLYDPSELVGWNVNPNESSPLTLALQHRMSDYRTPTDRQHYRNEEGDIVWEPAGIPGANATRNPLHEFRVLAHGKPSRLSWTAGLAWGQQLAESSLAYDYSARQLKPVTDFYSLEGRLENWPWALWGHLGYGVWGPEPFQRFFGESFDRLWGLGGTYRITRSTQLDVSYLAARQSDALHVAPDLGGYSEIRTMISHRFGFVVQFQEPSRPGYKAR